MTTLNAPQLNVSALKNKYKLQNFIETGCWIGQGLEFAQSIGFNNLYSCDINDSFVSICKEKFTKAIIMHHPSTEFLKKILPDILGPSLFWLDAHYPVHYGHTTENNNTKFPLLEEVRLVLSLKQNFEKDVFILDDLRVMHPENNPFFNTTLDKKFLVDLKIDDFIKVLSPTHNYYFVDVDTGNIIFTPK